VSFDVNRSSHDNDCSYNNYNNYKYNNNYNNK